MANKQAKFVGLAKRWFISTVLLVVVVVVAIVLLLCLNIRNSYYNTVSQTLEFNSGDMLSSYYSIYADETEYGFSKFARNYVDNFPDKKFMEVWFIDSSGKVVLSSSGFDIDEEYLKMLSMPDYEQALTSATNDGKWTGKLPSGEKIMAVTSVVMHPNGTKSGAVRFMVSLERVDEQLLKLSLLIAFLGLSFLLFIVASGFYFIRSIINPIKQINETANRIADGDLDARIDHYSNNDELGDLCNTINNMANELGTAEQMKNDFISTVSHELRTPLTAIKGWGETLLQLGDTDPDTTKRGMSVIIGEAARLNDLVEELLDFSRINTGRMTLNIEKIDVLAELDEVVFTFKERAIKEGIEVIYNSPSYPAPVNGDAARIKQVFINIIDNAIKYNEHGGKVIVQAELVNKASLQVRVSDTGKGISPEALPKVKEKFFKADTSVRGSGIGLAVADEIVRLHNGELLVDSILGEGTAVTITLPVIVSKTETEGVLNADEQERNE